MITADSDEANTLTEPDTAGPAWRRSSYCGDSSCVEVAVADEFVLVRDAKDPTGPVLRFTLDGPEPFGRLGPPR
jgi:hypothetical protein